MASRSKAYSEGLKIRRRWLGKAYVDKAFGTGQEVKGVAPVRQIIEDHAVDDSELATPGEALKLRRQLGAFHQSDDDGTAQRCIPSRPRRHDVVQLVGLDERIRATGPRLRLLRERGRRPH